MIYLGSVKAPIGVIRRGDIPKYLDDDFYSMSKIWNNSRLLKAPVYDKPWPEWPHYVVEIMTGFEAVYEKL